MISDHEWEYVVGTKEIVKNINRKEYTTSKTKKTISNFLPLLVNSEDSRSVPEAAVNRSRKKKLLWIIFSNKKMIHEL